MNRILIVTILIFNHISVITSGQTIDKKNELLFVIDEGRRGKELVTLYKDDLTQLDKALKNVCDALEPLKAKYDVTVLIYPNWLYNENGFGEDATIGVNRIHPALRHTFVYMKQRGFGVYLEMYSSGGYTNQNGELGNLPLVKKHYPSGETIKSIPMDLECLEDIFAKYDIVKGIRLHELIGTNNRGHKGDPHTFKVDFDFIREMAEMCKAQNRHFVWGDHAWDRLITKPDEYGFWKPFSEEICGILGNNITVNFNNNGWSSQFTATRFELPMKNYCGNNNWGYSVQSWYWQGRESQVLPKKADGTTRFYLDTRLDMPIELMAAFTIETFNRGGTLVQYEPSDYFFNHYGPSAKEIDKYGQCEREADYLGKLTLAHLTDILLNYDQNPSAYPSMKPGEYYTDNRAQYLSGRWSQQPKTYYQTTLGALGNQVKYYDTYCSNTGKWYNWNKNDYRDWVLNGQVVDVTRTKVDFRLIDELLVVRADHTAAFYNHLSTHYTNCDNLVEPNTDGTYRTIASLNLKTNYALPDKTFFGDPDEIVVVRTSSSKAILTAYEKIFVRKGATRRNFAYQVDNTLTETLSTQFGEIQTANFVGICPIRTENYLRKDNTRPIDQLFLLERNGNDKIRIRGVGIDVLIDIDPSTILDVKSADIDSDCRDEIALLVNDNSVVFYSIDRDGNISLHSKLDKVGENARKIFSTRWTSYYNYL